MSYPQDPLDDMSLLHVQNYCTKISIKAKTCSPAVCQLAGVSTAASWKSFLLPVFASEHTAGTTCARLQACSLLPPDHPLHSPPCPQAPASPTTSPQAVLPSCPQPPTSQLSCRRTQSTAVLVLGVCSRYCSTLEDRSQCGEGPRSEN